MQEFDANGVHYIVYYPEGVDPSNIDPNTQVSLYMHGGGGGSWQIAYDAVNKMRVGDTNSIVIIPNASNRSTDNFFDNVIDVYDNFISENGINQNNLVVSGYSSGYYSTFGVLDEYLERHPNSDAASVYLVETYPQTNDEYLNNINGGYNYNAYKKNGTMFFSYTGAYGNDSEHPFSLGETYNKILNPLVDNGCNVINILEARISSHHGAEQVFFEDSVIDFSDGDKTLTDDKYYYEVRNPNTGLWELVSVEDIDTINKVRKYFNLSAISVVSVDESYLENLQILSSLELSTSVSNDSNVVLSNINNVYTAIKNSSFVSSNYSCSLGESSTTKVPSSIPEIINKYFCVTSDILCGLATLLKKCEEANALMEETEEEMEKDTEELNEPEIVDLDSNDDELLKEDISKTDTSGADSEFIDIGNDDEEINDSINGEKSKNNLGNNDISKNDTYTSQNKSEWNQANESPKEETNTITNWKDEFPEYDELYSTNDKVVFDYNNEYKIILHRNGDTITGIEYYYDFGNSENASNALFKLKSMYGDSGMENILMKDRYVKVIFNNNVFGNLSVSEFRNKYSNLNEIIRV